MLRTGFAFVVACLLVTATLVAQTSSQTTQQTPPQTGKPAGAPMTMDCQQMSQAHHNMMEQMKAMDSRLDTLVQQMNSASGQAKIDATAAVVNEMVTQRKAMRERMEGMQGRMMLHMMEHMHAGGADGLKKCPMMEHMK